MDGGKSTLLWFFFLSTSFLCFNFVRSSARFPKLLFCFLLGYFSNRRRAPRTDALASVQFRPWRECRRVQLDVKFFFSLSLFGGDHSQGKFRRIRRIIITKDITIV